MYTTLMFSVERSNMGSIVFIVSLVNRVHDTLTSV